MIDASAVRSIGRFAYAGVAFLAAAGVVWVVYGDGAGTTLSVLLVAAVVAFGVAANRLRVAAEADDDETGRDAASSRDDDEDSDEARRQKARKMGFGGNG